MDRKNDVRILCEVTGLTYTMNFNYPSVDSWPLKVLGAGRCLSDGRGAPVGNGSPVLSPLEIMTESWVLRRQTRRGSWEGGQQVGTVPGAGVWTHDLPRACVIVTATFHPGFRSC